MSCRQAIGAIVLAAVLSATTLGAPALGEASKAASKYPDLESSGKIRAPRAATVPGIRPNPWDLGSKRR
jgi:hypothetical protein